MAGPDWGKQVGPLPLGAWVVVVGGGLGIAWWSRRQNGETGIPTNTANDPGVGEGINAVSIVPFGGPGGADPNAVKIVDNTSWGVAAINRLKAMGFDPALCVSAITKALGGGVDDAGNRMSAQEYALYGMAVGFLGSMPTPVNVLPPTSGIGTPVTPVPVPPAPGPAPSIPSGTNKPFAKITVQKGFTLWELAGFFYHNPMAWISIWNANKAGTTRVDGTPGVITDPNKIYVGQDLIIPFWPGNGT